MVECIQQRSINTQTNENILKGQTVRSDTTMVCKGPLFWYLCIDWCMRPEWQVNYLWHPFVICRWRRTSPPNPTSHSLFISIVTHKENILTSRLNQQFCIWRAPVLNPGMTPFIQRASMIFLNTSYTVIPAFSTAGITICTAWRYFPLVLADTRRLLTADARVR